MNQINNNQKPITYAKYKRKSTDETDRQILSLESQENESSRQATIYTQSCQAFSNCNCSML